MLLIPIATFCWVQNSFSQDLVYKPKNPAFGGDTFNYNWLLSSAQAQDLKVDTRPNRGLGTTSNSADDFANSLNRLLLSQLSREIITSQFGEDGLTDGLYSLGDFQVDVATTLEGLVITIFDQVQGGQTQIVIPFL
ncbi:MAG: curli assembly protein CsgF [Lewinellaceae bacterium]|nr:curli assembly protein CsgF [Lewinellaceae bacterium]